MKGRHQFKRRFSLQPSFMKDDSDDEKPSRCHNRRAERPVERESSESGSPVSNNVNAANKVKHKIVVMGASRTGKSSIIQQFLYNTFSPKYKRTIEEMHHGDFDVNGVHLTLQILDTSGENEFPAMRNLSISNADAFILVYDVCDASTFEVVRAIRDQILETKGSPAVPIVVVGNKVDLAQNRREVDFNTTESVVTVDWENGFVETSAKDGTNVSKVFKELLNQAKVKYNLSPALSMRRKRRQSLPPQNNGSGPATGTSSAQASPAIPSLAQLQHLEQIREKHSGGKRNSCILS
ncbi:UNVERIFIED_CONTAM: hypothetical protein PYX00_005254 [Menopon gallinae]|uniref:GTP-binding protein Rhes n=1 Tax=Menopon gallinae TaxID=328185 RepID=A0AAW2HQH3_9NEOP